MLHCHGPQPDLSTTTNPGHAGEIESETTLATTSKSGPPSSRTCPVQRDAARTTHRVGSVTFARTSQRGGPTMRVPIRRGSSTIGRGIRAGIRWTRWRGMFGNRMTRCRSEGDDGDSGRRRRHDGGGRSRPDIEAGRPSGPHRARFQEALMPGKRLARQRGRLLTVGPLPRALIVVGEGWPIVGVRAFGDDEFGALFRRQAA